MAEHDHGWVPRSGEEDSGREFVGEFETHVTVGCGNSDLPGLERWAVTRGLKLTHIVLDRGRTPSQPMVTLRGQGTLRQQQEAARAVADELLAAGYPPVRTKIEATPWTDGVPEHDADDARSDPARYFEHHVKVLLPAHSDADGARLTAVAVSHQAHLSRNARRTDHEGRRQRFVTQRCHGVGRRTADARLDRLIDAITEGGFDIVSVEREFVVLDSNLAIDDGWMEEEAAR
jgi:hypothetical protein